MGIKRKLAERGGIDESQKSRRERKARDKKVKQKKAESTGNFRNHREMMGE